MKLGDLGRSHDCILGHDYDQQRIPGHKTSSCENIAQTVPSTNPVKSEVKSIESGSKARSEDPKSIQKPFTRLLAGWGPSPQKKATSYQVPSLSTKKTGHWTLLLYYCGLLFATILGEDVFYLFDGQSLGAKSHSFRSSSEVLNELFAR